MKLPIAAVLLLFAALVGCVSPPYYDNQVHHWPQLLGLTVDRAKEYFRVHHPNYQIVCHGELDPVTADLRMDRVRLFHDANDIVISIPHNG